MRPRLDFAIPGPPVPCQRVRATVLRRGKFGPPVTRADGSPVVHMYTPAETETYERHVAAVTTQVLTDHPTWAELALSNTFFRVHLHFVITAQRGDPDNYQKSVLDGIKKANRYRPEFAPGLKKPRQVFIWGVYRDDSRVRQTLVSVNVDPRGQARCEVLVEPTCGVLVEPLWMAIAREQGWGPRPCPTSACALEEP